MPLKSSQKLALIKKCRKMGYGGPMIDIINAAETHMANGGKLIKTDPDPTISGGATQDRKKHVGLMQQDLAQYNANTVGAFSPSPTLLADGGDLDKDKIITWKDDKDYIQGIADWGIASDVPISTRQSEDIKRKLRTGNYGYNPATGALSILPEEQRGTISAADRPYVEETIAASRRTAEEQAALTKAKNDKALAAQRAGKPNVITLDQFTPSYGKPGETIRLSNEELADYYKEWDKHSYDDISKGVLWNAPGMIATSGAGALGAAGALSGVGAGASQVFQDPKNPMGYITIGTSILPYSKNIAKSLSKDLGINKFIENLAEVNRQKKAKSLYEPSIREGVEEGNKWLDEWVSDPITQQKIKNQMQNELSNFDPSDFPELTKIEKSLSEFEPNTGLYPIHRQYIEAAQTGLTAPLQRARDIINPNMSYLGDHIHKGNWGIYYDKSPSFLSPRAGAWVSRTIPSEKIPYVSVHEGVHEWTKGNQWLPSETSKVIQNNIKNYDEFAGDIATLSKKEIQNIKNNYPEDADKIIRELNEDMGKIRNSKSKRYEYLSDPTEVHARVMELRKFFNLTPSDKISTKKGQEILDKIIKVETPVEDDFADLFKDGKALSNIMNKSLAVAPIAGISGLGIAAGASEKAHGGPLNQYQTPIGIYAYGGPMEREGLEKRILKKYPAFTNVFGEEGENLHIVKDKNFDPKAHSDEYGDIEFMFPNVTEIPYTKDYTYQSPFPGDYVVAYNPKSDVTKGDIFLDMLHGMRGDNKYNELLKEFKDATLKHRGEDILWEWDDVKNNPDIQLALESQNNTAFQQFEDNYVDGMLRSHLANMGMGKKSKDPGYEIERKFNSKEMEKVAKKIYDYLKTNES
jgi:hypothetical protein